MTKSAKAGAERGPGRPAGKDRPDLKSDLLHAAIDLFGSRGFDGVSLSQISGAVQADVGLTRYYFGSKAELWEAAMTHLSECFVRDLMAELELAEASKTDALKAIIRAFVMTSARWPQISRIIVFDGDKSDARSKFIESRLVGPFYDLMADLIEGAKREGAVPDVSVRTIFFMITHGGSFPMALRNLTNAFPGGDIASRDALDAHADAIIALIMRVS